MCAIHSSSQKDVRKVPEVKSPKCCLCSMYNHFYLLIAGDSWYIRLRMMSREVSFDFSYLSTHSRETDRGSAL